MENRKTPPLRCPSFRGKLVREVLVRSPVSLHTLKKLTGKETGSGDWHTYQPSDIRKLKLTQYGISPGKRTRSRPPIINCRMAKGGTGKTTVAANLATAFSFMGYRVLMIDADPQASLTNMMGIDASSENIIHIGQLMENFTRNKQEIGVGEAIWAVFPDGMLDIIPADITLTNADIWLMNQMQRETIFDRMIGSHEDFFGQYDVIVIDSAPGTSLLTLNIMVAAKTQLAVCWLDRENLKALPILFANVEEINTAYPSHASDIEIVANGYSATYKQSREVLEILVTKYPKNLNENVIQQFSGFHRQQSLPGGDSKGAVVEQYPSSAGAKAMFDLAKSLLGRYRITLSGFDESVPSTRTSREK